MKTILLFFLGSLLTLSLAGQRSDYPGHWNDGSRLTPHEQREETSRRSFRHAVLLPALKSAANMMVLDSRTLSRWKDASSTWEPDYRAYYDYNEDGLIREFRSEEWNDASGSWELDDLETYEYSENGDLMLLLDYDPSETGEGWDISWKRESTYQDGRVSEYTESQWDDEGEFYDPVWRVVFLYDDAGRVSGTREFIHTFFTWRETWRTEYIYDENGNLVTFIDYDDSDSEPSGWEYAWKEEYTYGDDEYLDLYEEFKWDEDNDLWLNSDREEFTIAANGDVESYIDFDWSEEGSAWEMSWKGEYEYDTDTPYERLYLPYFYQNSIPNFFNHRLTRYTSFVYEAGEWLNNYSGEYHYTELGATGYDPAVEKKVLLYPNPVADMLHIRAEGRRLKQVELFDMTGRKVLSARIDGGNSVNLGVLDQGTYFCRVTDRNDREVVSQMILVTGE